VTDYGVAVLADGKQRVPIGFDFDAGRRCCFLGAAVAEAVTLDVHEKFGISIAIMGMAVVLPMIFFVAESYIEGIIGIRGMAFGTGFATFAFGVVDDIRPAWRAGAFRFHASVVARGADLRLGATGCN
jgi:hypothetical protein